MFTVIRFHIYTLMQTRFIVVFLLTFFSFLSKANDATSILLEGTIGKTSIVMELSINGTEISGNYYYKQFKKTIPLEGKYIDAQTIELIYEHWNNKETFILKNLSTDQQFQYTGTWKNEPSSDDQIPTPLPLTVRLKEVNVNTFSIKNDFVTYTHLSKYDYSRLADISFIQDSIQVINNEFTITWLRDTQIGFSSFRINKNIKLNRIDSINTFLEQLHFSEILSNLDCLGSEYSSSLDHVFIKGHVLSFDLSVSYECGGAHPDYGIEGFTFNMETGNQLILTDFLYFGKTETDYEKGESYKLGSEIMGPNIVKLLTKIYPKEMKKPSAEDDVCDYSASDVWDYTPWYLTKDGLYLYPYFYRAARCCDGAEFSIIPYKTLTKYKNPNAAIPMKY